MLEYLNIDEITLGLINSKNNEKVLILEHNFNGAHVMNYISDKEINLIQTKYEGFKKDRPKMSHYAELYQMGKIFNN